MLLLESHLQRKSFVAFHNLPDHLAADRLNRVENVRRIQVVAGHRLPTNADSEVGKSCNTLSADIRRAGDLLHDRGNLVCLLSKNI